MAKDNRTIGQFNLDGIPPAQRGVPQIEVTFDIDANGILQVSAKDKATGKAQNIRIEASSGLSKEEIAKMKNEAEANAEADKKARESVDKFNQADSLIFQTEKQLKEFGDKIPAEKRGPIDSALAELKKAHEAKDEAGVDKAMNDLNTVFQAAAQEMYAQKGGEQEQASGNGSAEGATAGGQDQEVTDVDFEEVSDKEKK
jgi:molecular chaperone DnaK